MKTGIVTDSNSGFTPEEAKEYGVYILPMPFTINNTQYLEGESLSQDDFYRLQDEGADIFTSQPSAGAVTDLWDDLLKEYDEIVHIPMASSLSGSCETAIMLSKEYDGKVQVVDNLRISVPQKQSVFDAVEFARQGKSALEIKKSLEETGLDAYIYIMVDTLVYLKKGGRITAAAAAFGTLLKIKPVLQIHGEKLDAFAKARTVKHAKSLMMDAVHDVIEKKFDGDPNKVWIQIAYTKDREAAEAFKEEVQSAYPNHEIRMNPLPLSIACHVGPGAIGVACVKKIEE